MIRGQNLSSVWNRTINIQYTDRVSLSYLSGNLAKVFTRKSAPKPKKSLPANSTITVVPTTGGVPTPSPSEESSPPSVRLRGPSSASDVCPALWIHTTTNNEGRLTMILIIIIIIKITSPTNNLPSSTSQKWKIKKKKKKSLCQRYGLSSGLGSTTMEGRRINGGKSSPHQRRSRGLFVSPPCFSSSLPFQCRVSLPPSFFLSGLVSFCRCVSLVLSRVSGPGRSCSTSVWSTHGCRTWTSAPAGSRPLCLHLCILVRERRAKKNSVKAAARNVHFVLIRTVWRKDPHCLFIDYWLQEAGHHQLMVLLDIVHP